MKIVAENEDFDRFAIAGTILGVVARRADTELETVIT